jgi:HK97 family phage major capsid protein
MSNDTGVMLSRADLESALLKHHEGIETSLEKIQGQVDETGSAATEVKSELEAHAAKADELAARLAELEQKHSAPQEDTGELSIGEQFIKSEDFQALAKGRIDKAVMETDHSLGKTAIVNATGQNQPLVPADRRDGWAHLPNRRFTIRDLIPSVQTGSNLIEYVRESGFTNNAGAQVGGSPEAFENVAKSESGITFSLEQEAVQTIAHWIPASRQVLSDAPALQSYINGRLMYGLKLKEETELLNGTGANGRINGLVTQATAYATESPEIADATTKMDTIRRAILQAEFAEYAVNGLVVNPYDWAEIEMLKVNSGTDDRYLVGDPRNRLNAVLWSLPVVATNSMAQGSFLLGAFDMGAMIHDRWDMSVEVAREHSDYFTKNMVAILCEERLALTVSRTESLITGSF